MKNVFGDFLLKNGLYSRIEINESNISDLIELLSGDCKLNVFCHGCGENSVFSMGPLYYYYGGIGEIHKELLSSVIHRVNGTTTGKWRWNNKEIRKYTKQMTFVYKCGMDPSHSIVYSVVTSENEMIKIGQFPSEADFEFAKLKKYGNIIDNTSRKELGTSIGLHAHGVGIGSYVYLRRILERIVDDSAIEILDKNEYENEFQQLRMGDRIKKLEGVLPKGIVENKAIYGILSKGIHELSEEECLMYYPVLLDCTFLILNQKEEKRERDILEKRISTDIQKISMAVKS